MTFTVFTASFNRAHTIIRTYNSLVNQSFKDFEWLIVDDGSTDNTDQTVSGFIKKNEIDITYIKKNNGGKHTAWNIGLDNAKGDFFIILDADDFFLEDTLFIFHKYYKKIVNNDSIAGITGLCIDTDDNIVGNKYPFNELIGKPLEINSKYNIYGDKCGGYKTKLVRHIKFPIFEDEKFITEGILINRISKYFNNLFINEILCGVEYQEQGLSSNSLKLRVQNIKGTLLYYTEAYKDYSFGFQSKYKNLINLLRFKLHDKSSRLFENDKIPFLEKISIFPFAYILYLKDRWKLK
ncbi:glycosyltransferase family A protein [Elizabethkingia ursingii]|jgi:glycosyltransferase involved in cell wall biosynthesis|uniref:Glycosyltransferase 2-like domain-containing protein n=1 Tax=Elizabethkingia ursingii TaxID=1756150 RepID=A0AAJ3NAZ6_9FLAO|nr:glycosyltransferase family 2 protein [Elizabethkingia ursingii]AQX08204.1 hypothetical protein BBD34_05895 [Elizabethkingia ursingii]MDR2229249.1 glycosyltransferase family 2 protein [Flavobacteriaceae bacterium]OPB73440.1 hypothetical protein BAY32_10325 [Elizabethkingia ursingii]OPB86958.1 hypothetical protein BB021_10615 [Elizabethkingia ursingii]